jgi:hypothetical protein
MHYPYTDATTSIILVYGMALCINITNLKRVDTRPKSQWKVKKCHFAACLEQEISYAIPYHLFNERLQWLEKGRVFETDAGEAVRGRV